MLLIDVKTDNITDYKKTSMYLVFPYCSGKCGPECQNKHLRNISQYIQVRPSDIVDLYATLKTHEAIVMGGLEPLDSIDDVIDIIKEFNNISKPCDIVIYTGYTEEEYKSKFELDIIDAVKSQKNKVIVKIGRYDSSKKPGWFSNELGVELATSNQIVKVYNPNGTGSIERKAISEDGRKYKEDNYC